MSSKNKNLKRQPFIANILCRSDWTDKIKCNVYLIEYLMHKSDNCNLTNLDEDPFRLHQNYSYHDLEHALLVQGTVLTRADMGRILYSIFDMMAISVAQTLDYLGELKQLDLPSLCFISNMWTKT